MYSVDHTHLCTTSDFNHYIYVYVAPSVTCLGIYTIISKVTLKL